MIGKSILFFIWKYFILILKINNQNINNDLTLNYLYLTNNSNDLVNILN